MSAPTLTPSLPTMPSARLLGVELEIDANKAYKMISASGWARHSDGSLSQNGSEFVIEPPLPFAKASKACTDLCEKLVDINVRKSGGLHVHVQVADYSLDDAYNLVKLYTHFQPVINRLVGQSRVHNRFCPAYPQSVTKQDVISKFQLNRSARTRLEAKGSRAYSVVNLAMMRCTNPDDRSVEFRQGSVSKRAICVGGWAALMLAFVEIAKQSPPQLEPTHLFKKLLLQLKQVLTAYEQSSGARGLVTWLEWRYEYLNGSPTMAAARKLAELLVGGHKGLYTISRTLDTNLAYAKRLLDFAVAKGLIAKHTTKELWMVTYEHIAEDDLARLERYGRTEGTIVETVTSEVEAAVDVAAAPPPPSAVEAVMVAAPTAEELESRTARA